MKSLSFALAGFVVLVGSASAQSNTLPPFLSDELLVSDPAGGVIQDSFLTEGANAAGIIQPETATFSVPGAIDGVQGVNTAPLNNPAALLPQVKSVVALLESPNDVPEPGVTPIYVQTPYGTRQLSDLVISFNNPNGLPGVAFISDGDGNLNKWNIALGGVYANALEETGALQDVTPLLQTPYKVQVASDIAAVPEPSAYGMLLTGLGVFGAILRKSAKRS